MHPSAGWAGARASRQPVDRVPVVNGLRRIAILLVLYYHLLAGTPSSSEVAIPLSPLLTNGWSGVSLSLVLSCPVLFLPYGTDDHPLQNLGDRSAFYRRRFLRLMPLLDIAVVVEWSLRKARRRTISAS